MKRNICIALCAALLAAPAPARALKGEMTNWEVKDVTHTVTAKVGENSFILDGEEISLPEGMEVYQKDGRVMLPAESFLELIGNSRNITWYREEGEPITVFTGETIWVFDIEKNEMYQSGNKVELAGTLEDREGNLFLPLRDWASALGLDGYTVEAVTWDSKTMTALLQFSGQELEAKEPAKHTPAGKGSEPEYILKPTEEYKRIKSLGYGYFSAMKGKTSAPTDVMDNTGKILQSYEAGVNVEYLGENRFLVVNYNKEPTENNVVDENGKIVFSAGNRGSIQWYSEGLAKVRGGFVDVNGKMTVPAPYEEAEPFSEGLAAVCLEGRSETSETERWGYIDRSGRLVIPAKYEKCDAFREGLAAVKSGGKWGYIDHTGREVIPLQYDWVSYFYDGTAFVQERNTERNINTWVIDKTGRKQKLLSGDRPLFYVFSDYPALYPGILKAEEAMEYTGGHAHVITYYDANGEIPNEKIEWVTQSAEGLMVFQDKETGKYGYVDEGYRWVIAPVFDDAGDFEDGYAIVGTYLSDGSMAYGIIQRP